MSAPVLTALLAFATACDGGTGDRCELDEDCESGLRCVSIGANPWDKWCQPQQTTDARVTDTGIDVATDVGDGGSGADGATD